jgi:hypothetical protein
MKCTPVCKNAVFPVLIGVLLQISPTMAANGDAASEQQIRKVVESMLQEKNQKIEQLEARIKQLEAKQTPDQPTTAVAASDRPKPAVVESLEAPPGSGIGAVAVKSGDASDAAIMNKLGELGEEITELRTSAEEKGLDISGFFDVNAKTDNSTDQTFSVGSVELDLEYAAF